MSLLYCALYWRLVQKLTLLIKTNMQQSDTATSSSEQIVFCNHFSSLVSGCGKLAEVSFCRFKQFKMMMYLRIFLVVLLAAYASSVPGKYLLFLKSCLSISLKFHAQPSHSFISWIFWVEWFETTLILVITIFAFDFIFIEFDNVIKLWAWLQLKHEWSRSYITTLHSLNL